jgi:ribonuclease VapC
VIGAPTLVEASAVMVARSGSQGAIALDALLQRLHIDVIPMTARAAAHARTAYTRWGKGVGAPGVLNFGDCPTYGVATALEMPILFKGADFTRTDARPASY